VPATAVCNCFGWTRDGLRTTGVLADLEIRTHITASRCGCEVNNPKGACGPWARMRPPHLPVYCRRSLSGRGVPEPC
jgi:hypothetical protein